MQAIIKRLARLGLLGYSVFLVCFLLLVVWLVFPFSGRQPVTTALDVGLSMLRLGLPVLLAIFVQELVARELEGRLYLSSLAYPVSRVCWLLQRYLTVVFVVLLLLALCALALASAVAYLSMLYSQSTPVSLGWPYVLTILFYGIDLLVLTSFAFFLAVVARTPSFVLLGTLGFMLIARSYSSVIYLLAQDAWLVADSEGYRSGLGWLGYMLPDLGGLDVRMIALYGKYEMLPSDWPFLVLSSLFYSLVLLLLALWCLQRKRFF